MEEIYRLLVPRETFEKLQRPPVPKKDLHNFLNDLVEGKWEYDKEVEAWHVDGKYVYTKKIGEKTYAVYELLWTINTAAVFRGEGKRISPHVVLWHIGEFPGDLEYKKLSLGEKEFEYEGKLDRQRHITLYQREQRDELTFDREIYFLPKKLFGEVLEGKRHSLILQLTDEELKTFEKRTEEAGPIFLRGVAGSGKTLLSLYWLLKLEKEAREKGEKGKFLYITLSEKLKETVKDIYSGLLPFYQEPYVEFKTFVEFVDHILGQQGITNNTCNLEQFCLGFGWKHRKDVDIMLLWEEIQNNIKGESRDPDRPLIDKDEYLKKFPPDMKDLKEKYYEKAKKYQEYLQDNKLKDSTDLARECLTYVDQENWEKYDAIACDEVQDLAPVQIYLLMRSVKDLKKLFFAGDVTQIISPSGFSWGKLKNLFYDQNVKIGDVISLKTNLRSTKQISDVINVLLDLRHKYVDPSGETVEERKFESKKEGDKPIRLNKSPIDVIKSLEVKPTERMILTKNEEEKKEILKKLEGSSITVLTVGEAKGLEADGVLLWNFSKPTYLITKSPWERFISGRIKGETRKEDFYKLIHELNLLHVALTRSRRYLFFYDEDETSPTFDTLVPDALLNKLDDLPREKWKTDEPTPDDYISMAEKIFSSDPHQANREILKAAELYATSGESDNAGKIAEKWGDKFKNIYESSKDEEIKELARKDFEKAEKYFKYDLERARVLAKLRELEEKWEEAGERWREYYGKEKNENQEKLKEYCDRGGKCFEKANNNQKAAEAYGFVADKIKDATVKYKLLLKSSACWENANERKKALDTLMEARDVVKSLSTYREELPKIQEKIGDLKEQEGEKDCWKYYKEAGDRYYELYQPPLASTESSLTSAFDCWEKAVKSGEKKPEEKIEIIERALDAAKEHEQRKKFANFCRLFLEAIETHTKINEDKLKVYEEYVDYLRRDEAEPDKAELAAKIGKKIGEIWKDLGNFNKAIDIWEKSTELAKKGREWKLAAEILKEIGKEKERIGKKDEAKKYLEDAGDMYYKAKLPKEAFECFEIVVGWLKQEPWVLGEYWLEILHRYQDFEKEDRDKIYHKIETHFHEYLVSRTRVHLFAKLRELREKNPSLSKLISEIAQKVHADAVRKGVIKPRDYANDLELLKKY